jgi:hypothetical protein
MTGEELLSLLDRVISAKGASLQQQESVCFPTTACYSVPRLERGARTADWTEEEQRHLAGCAACQRTLAIIQRLGDLEEFEAEEAKIVITDQPVMRS